ncbi:MAG: quinone-dependent dihydroorotate dehydrogenase [Deltaproteobacteria bacterium]|nr:quinone-dependent dihydroorotate dehydrogenase [Deltaproteobacteria bacterium]
MLYETLLAPLLFRIDAETAHNGALSLLRQANTRPWLQAVLAGSDHPPDPRLEQNLCGMHFRNPIGLAAGFDKNGIAAPALAALGFGFITVGSVTPGRGQPGNPRPRLFRDVPKRALWNRLGFNNRGADTLAEVLEAQPRPSVPLGISLGKARETPIDDAFEDYASSMETLYPYADFFEICISSPNTQNLRELQEGSRLENLLTGLVKKAGELARSAGMARRKPLWPKFAPDMPPILRDIALAKCRELLDTEIDAVIIGNTTIDPAFNPDPSKGGYSGPPLFPKALDQVRGAAAALAGRLTLVGNGGIFNGGNAYTMMKASGCALVQVHSAFPYRGPRVAKRMEEELLEALDRDGLRHMSEMVTDVSPPT